MKSLLALGVLVLLTLTGCSQDNNPLISDPMTAAGTVPAFLGKATPGTRDITYGISLVNVAYNGTGTTFEYTVTSNPQGGPAISHLVLVLDPECGVPVILNSSDPATEWSHPDPTTGVTGIKFDTGYDDQEVRTVTFTLAGEWSSDVIGLAVKAGNGFVLGSVNGPHCEDVVNEVHITGTVFFDINGSGVQDPDEPGIEGVNVLLNNGESIATVSNGSYDFTVEPGSYVLTVETIEGLISTTPVSVSQTVSNENVSVNFGINLNMNWAVGQTANGFTIGFWKNNIRKAIDGNSRGTQISAATLTGYLTEIAGFALSPFAYNSLQEAFNTLSATGSSPVTLLAKQLLGSEFNYMNDAYIGGNELYTRLLMYYGEYLMVHAGEFSASQLLTAKDLFDAYNNTHGGALVLN